MLPVTTLYQFHVIIIRHSGYILISLYRSIQILPSRVLGVVGHHPADLPIDNMCLTHDGSLLVSGSQDVCKFWCMDSIPTLPGASSSSSSRGGGVGAAGEGDAVLVDASDEGCSAKRKKRKRKMKHRLNLPAAKDSRTDDFFSDLCS